VILIIIIIIIITYQNIPPSLSTLSHPFLYKCISLRNALVNTAALFRSCHVLRTVEDFALFAVPDLLSAQQIFFANMQAEASTASFFLNCWRARHCLGPTWWIGPSSFFCPFCSFFSFFLLFCRLKTKNATAVPTSDRTADFIPILVPSLCHPCFHRRHPVLLHGVW
jgi:hypothetical protein